MSALHGYYSNTTRLNELLDDPFVPIDEALEELDLVIRRDQSAADYYRQHPELLYPGHPWMQFVATGEAAAYGWFAHEAAALKPPPFSPDYALIRADS